MHMAHSPTRQSQGLQTATGISLRQRQRQHMLLQVGPRLLHALRQQQEAVAASDVAAVGRVWMAPAGAAGRLPRAGWPSQHGKPGAVAADQRLERWPLIPGSTRRGAEGGDPGTWPHCATTPAYLKSASSACRSSGVEKSVSWSLMGRPACRARCRAAVRQQGGGVGG